MKTLFFVLLLLSSAIIFAQNPVEKYPVDSASVEHAGVPKGEILKFTFANSKIYPGTWREYWVYIPAEYDPAKAACVFVDQDGIQFKSPTVFDNLIYRKEMPVTIGVYISPGRVLAKDTTALDRYNRSFEFDGLGDAYARFVLDEILPDVEKHKTGKGLPIVLSHKGNDRMIAGTSSGAICAFTAAWERPDAFSRVMSGIGTYVGLRGGDRYSTLIRKYEPKPIRIFLQDGSHDQNIYAGDWFYANQMMERSLEFAGYEVNHAWGEGAHTGNQSTAIFPDAMRWLWKDYPAPVKTGRSKNAFLDAILIDREGWNLVTNTNSPVSNLCANHKGEINFDDRKRNKYYHIDSAGNLAVELSQPPPKLRDKNGKLIPYKAPIANVSENFHAFSSTTGQDLVSFNILGNDYVAFSGARNTNRYFTEVQDAPNTGRVFSFDVNRKRITIDQGLNNPYGLVLTPDHSQLYITESNTHWVWIYNINTDGTLSNKQRYGWLHTPDTTDNAQARGIKCDRDGRVYVATALGIQVLDQTGRVNAILPLPFNAGAPTQVCFGGKDFDELYVTCGTKIYRRKLKVRGINDFDVAVKPVKPRL